MRAEKVNDTFDETWAPSFAAGDPEKEQVTMGGTASTVESRRESSPRHRITLVCFNTPFEIASELESLSTIMEISDIVHHPHILWELITFHLSSFLDEEIYKLSECFGTEQRVRALCFVKLCLGDP